LSRAQIQAQAQHLGPAQLRWWLGAKPGDALALLAGLVLPFAFSPYKIWPLAVLAAALLFSVWLRAGARRAAWRGWLFGLGSFGVGVSWILQSFKFANVALPFAVFLTCGFIAFLSLYPAVGGYLLARIMSLGGSDKTQRPAPMAIQYLVLLPAGFVFIEWLRGWFLSGFGWLQLGYSQVDGPLRGLLPVVGVYGVSLMIVLSAGATVWLISKGKSKAIISGGLGLIMIWGIATGVRDHVWTEASGEAIKVALIQGNIPQDQKWLPQMRGPTLERYLRLTRKHWDARLILWPETSVPGTQRVLGSFLKQLDLEARKHNATVVYGIPEFDPTTGQAFNTTSSAGIDKGHYRKRHLVPFGEYLPLDWLLRPLVKLLNIPVSNFSSGPSEQPLLSVGDVPMAMFICYEIAFGQQVAAQLPEAALLATVSNDAWFGDSLGPHQHLQIARARAIETGRYLVRATNTGISVIVDPVGEVVARSPQFEVRSLAGQVFPMVGSTPYVRWGDWPVLGLVVVMLLVGIGMRLRQTNPGD
jgi:apolipoprotein N-acyltransferase